MKNWSGSTFSLDVFLVVMVLVMGINMVAGQKKSTCAECAKDQLCFAFTPYEGNPKPGVNCFIKSVGQACEPKDKTQLCGGKLVCDKIAEQCRKNVGDDCIPDDDPCATGNLNLDCVDNKCAKLEKNSTCADCVDQLCYEFGKYDLELNPGVFCFVRSVGDACNPKDETDLCGGTLVCDSVTKQCRKNEGDQCDSETDPCTTGTLNLVCVEKKCAKRPTAETGQQEQGGRGKKNQFPPILQKFLKALKAVRRWYRGGN